MKAMKYIIALALILGLVSCQPEMFNNNGNSSDAETVELIFSVQFPEPIPVTTKGTMGDGPRASEAFDIYLCLFGSGQGYVQNWIQATPVGTPTTRTYNGVDYITGGSFKALLPITDDKRTVHVIANPPAETIPTTKDYIDNVMEKMINGRNANGQYECSYWQEIVLPDGIHPDPDNGSIAREDVTTAFSGVRLLRNIAKVIVDGPYPVDPSDPESVLEENFVVDQWTLVNVPKKGYVAPYTGVHTDADRFPAGYRNAYLKTNPSTDALYQQLLLTDEYEGSMPQLRDTMINVAFPGDPSTAASGVYVGDGGAKYMYERPVPTNEQTQTAVLVQITFLPGHNLYREEMDNTYWYKIELLDNKGAYIPILRNFVYKLHIKGIDDFGFTTAEQAMRGNYFGNISASLETASLSELSNGKSTIYAKTLDYSIMSIPENGVVFLENSDFYFIPALSSDPDVPSEAFWKTTAGKCEITPSIERVTGYAPAITSYEFEGNDDGTGAGTIKVTPTALPTDPDTPMKKSIIRIKGKGTAADSRELYRDIMITVMTKPEFAHGESVTRITNTPDVSHAKQAVNLRICLPVGLGASVFPVQVRIEAEKNTLSANTPDLPVKTGKSFFDPTRNTFYFIYTINYSDYCWLDARTRKFLNKYEFDCTLLTTKEGTNSNSTQIMISDLRGVNADGTENPDKANFVSKTLTLGTL